MRDLNRFTVSGRFGREPEMKYTPNGLAVTRVSIAVSNDKYNETTKEWEDKTDWLPLVFFGKLAERVDSKCGKGAKVVVEGVIRADEYEKDGVKQKSFSFIADNLVIFSNGNIEERGTTSTPPPPTTAPDDDTPPWL